MKIIEGLKAQKNLLRKIEDLQKKIATHASYSSLERPVYRDDSNPDSQEAQAKQIAAWIQATLDLTKLLAEIRLRIQLTNLLVPVTIEVSGTKITKTIAEMIHWRREFADIMHKSHAVLTDKNIKEGFVNTSQQEKQEVKIIRCYNPAHRDRVMTEYMDMKYAIDSTLEIVNATTDMVDVEQIKTITRIMSDIRNGGPKDARDEIAAGE